MTRLEWAKWMAAKGLTVFILEPGSKRPLGGHSWYHRNTTDPDVVSDWFEEEPDCNYAVHPGAGYVVIDLDHKPGVNGIEAFEEVCAENGMYDFREDLGTLIVKTANGGYHLYFKTNFPCANKHDLPDGIDVRGAIGYVVGPGCEVTPEYKWSSGKYEVVDPDAEIAPLPDWLAEKMYEPGHKDPRHEEPLIDWDLPESIEQGREWLKCQLVAVQGDNGDDHTYWTVCALRDFALSESEIFKLLNEGDSQSWNARCDPPWSPEELQIKIENSFEYAANRPGIKSLAFFKQRHQSVRPVGGYQITDEQIREMFHPPRLVVNNTALKIEEDPEIPEALEDDDEQPQYEEIAHQFWYGFEDFMNREKIREYIVSGWLIAHGITGIIASRGTGKSTVALNLGCHLACDMAWTGAPTQTGWKVIYLCLEDDEGMTMNCRAWAKHHGRHPANDRFYVGAGTLNMNQPTVVKQRLQEMKAWVGDDRCLVVLDTWQRATSGLKSNADDEMELAVQQAEAIARAVKGPMLVCYHPPKDGRMTIRGSAVQEDTSSGLWSLEKAADGMLLTNVRAKGKGEGNWIQFNREIVELDGEDNLGDPLDGIVAVHVGSKREGTAHPNSSGDGVVDEVVRILTDRKEQGEDPIGQADLARLLAGFSADKTLTDADKKRVKRRQNALQAKRRKKALEPYRKQEGSSSNSTVLYYLWDESEPESA